jgi:hypothetical protein
MMRAAANPITVGTPVKFDSEHGTQLGKVSAMKTDLSNGCSVAAVEVPGTLDGQPWHVPVTQLQHAGA